MRFEMFVDGSHMQSDLRPYAESRVGLAIHRAVDRVSFVRVRLTREDGRAVMCRVEAWLRGLGVITAKHADIDSYVAIDRAAALLEQAVLRRLRAVESNATSPSMRRRAEHSASRDRRQYDSEEELSPALSSD
jgi:ribosome-associated translation inhibitor RaiA